jgi:hypothetical protein
MRPKTVLVTLALALGIVVAAIAFKANVTKKPADDGKSVADNGVPTATAPTNKAQAVANLSPEAAKAEVQKQLDEINELIADGPNNPAAASLLCDKLAHQPDAEVRAKALEGVVALNDTNAISRLEEAAQILEDPREKVAVMNAIEYLKLPDSTPDTPPTNGLSAAEAAALPPIKPTPGRLSPKEKEEKRRANARMQRQQRQTQQRLPQTTAPQTAPAQPAPSAPDATQPAAQPQDAAPPQ